MAEAHASDLGCLIYIIGTEVPILVGETEEPDALDTSSVERSRETIQTQEDARVARGLDSIRSRIVSVVTQPGVDFGHTSIYQFILAQAQPLSDAMLTEDVLTFEAHSTDYQLSEAWSEFGEEPFLLSKQPEVCFSTINLIVQFCTKPKDPSQVPSFEEATIVLGFIAAS